MNPTQIYTIILLTVAVTITTIAAAGIQEVCQWEKFEAKCHEDEVIMMKSAHYGRMRIGRCQKHKYFVGCSADVGDIMHARCSGRQHCSVQVPDPELFAASPCNKDLVSYLEADYECIKVATHSTGNCDDQILTAVIGDIAKPVTNTKNSVCPQRILAQPGQTVNVYLYDFYHKDTKAETTTGCISYGFIAEGSKTASNICGGEFRKKNLLYSSDSNVVDITLSDASMHSQHYILHYEIIGCPTPQPPKNGWVKIQDNTAVIMCNFSHIASELVCSGNEWVGDIHNCTSVDFDMLSPNALSLSSFGDRFVNSNAFPIACVVSTVLISIGVLMLVKMGCRKPKQVIDITDDCIIETPVLGKNEKVKPIDEYQPVYVPITLDNNGQYVPMHQNNIYESQRPGNISSLHSAHMPVAENIYGPFNSTQVASSHNCSHSIYNITGLTLGEDNIVNMNQTASN